MRDSKFIISAAALGAILGVGTASAADLPVRSYSKAPLLSPVSAVNWSGFYVGGNFGYGWGRANSDFTSTVSTANNNNTQDLNGVLGGGQIGYNWQRGMLVYGVEGDFQFTNQRGTTRSVDTNPVDIANVGGCAGLQVCTLAIVSTLNQKMPWFATARGRIGYLVNPSWMVFATGGVAFGKVKTDVRSVEPDTETDVSNWSETRVGWALGAGVEALLWDSWSWKAEYLHVDLGRGDAVNSPIFHSGIFTPFPAAVVGFLGINTKVTDDILRVGLNYHFRP